MTYFTTDGLTHPSAFGKRGVVELMGEVLFKASEVHSFNRASALARRDEFLREVGIETYPALLGLAVAENMPFRHEYISAREL